MVKFSRRRGRPARTIFALIDRPVFYNCVADTDSVHTKKLCSRLSSSEVHVLTENGRFAFLAPLGA